MTELKFEKEPCGPTVATIFEDESTIVEVQERNNDVCGLIVHNRNKFTDKWDDLTADLKPEHFEALGKVADHMRGSSRHAAGSFGEFHNRLRKLLNIDQHELIEAGIPASVRQFVMDAGHLIVSAAAAQHGSMENRALRRSWLAAIADLGMGEEEARSGGSGLWKRGFPAEQNEEDGA